LLCNYSTSIHYPSQIKRYRENLSRTSSAKPYSIICESFVFVQLIKGEPPETGSELPYNITKLTYGKKKLRKLAHFKKTIIYHAYLFNQAVDNCALGIILNRMAEYTDEKILSLILKAMSDTTRRSILRQLCQYGPSPVSGLAEHYEMSLNAVSKHIKVLENADLVKRKTLGRTHLIEANLEYIELAEQFLGELKSIWMLRLDKLDEVIGGKKDG
jgi:DNA-binding transcriptional ArsR family regulator